LRYELVEDAGGWIVRREGVEVARFDVQEDALNHVAEAMRGAAEGEAASLAVHYERRIAG
jgi:hypothetical protein